MRSFFSRLFGLEEPPKASQVAQAPAPPKNALLGHTDTVRSLAFSSDGAMLVSGSDDKTVRLWDVATHEPCGTITLGYKPTTVQFVANDTQILIGGTSPGAAVAFYWLEGERVSEITLSNHAKTHQVVPLASGAYAILMSHHTKRGKAWAAGILTPEGVFTKKQRGELLEFESPNAVLNTNGCVAWVKGEYQVHVEGLDAPITYEIPAKVVFLGDTFLVIDLGDAPGRDHRNGGPEGYDGLFFWDIETGKLLHQWSSWESNIIACQNGLLAAACWAGVGLLDTTNWQVREKRLDTSLVGENILCVALTPKADVIATGGATHAIYLHTL
jgi:WD domain, G-beta repeat